jgi:hypothetical protein
LTAAAVREREAAAAERTAANEQLVVIVAIVVVIAGEGTLRLNGRAWLCAKAKKKEKKQQTESPSRLKTKQRNAPPCLSKRTARHRHGVSQEPKSEFAFVRPSLW